MIEERDGKRSQLDLISELPRGVIETILVKLPVEDAVRTSILSSRWRYKWASMPDIVFDNNFTATYGKKAAQNSIEKFISTLLLLHNGPIRKFSLSSSYFHSTRNSDICQWLLSVSRKDVKDLVIDIRDHFKVPSCLFSCKNLTRLELSGCELNPPPNFKGFPCLKSLSIVAVVVSQDKLESLISSSHLLDNLKLSEIEMTYIDGVRLTVCAPNLKQLIIKGFVVELNLANTTNLVDLSVSVTLGNDIDTDTEVPLKNTKICHYEAILGGVPNLERLEGREYFTATAYISMQVDSLQRKPIVFSHLKTLELYAVDFNDPKEVLVVVQIITNCPILQDLQILSGSYQNLYENESQNLNYGDWIELLKLKTVNFSRVSGKTYEMKFIEYLLERSPALEQMRISPRYLSTDIELKIVTELVAFRRASTIVSVVFGR